MRFSNHGRFREQVRFLKRQFLQDGDLPFGDTLTNQIVAQAMTAVEGVWKDRIYSPLVTLWVFLSQVLSADHSCRAAVSRLIAHRVSRGESRLFRGDGRLLPSQKTTAGKVLLGRDMPGGTRVGCQGRTSLAVEGSAGLHVRRHDGHHARYPREPTSLSAGLQSEAGHGLSDRASRGHHFFVLWSDLESRRLPICGQRARRSQLTPPIVGRASSRRCSADRSIDGQLDEHSAAPGARHRIGRSSEQSQSNSRLPTREAPGQG